MKRIVCLILCVLLLIALSIPVFAVNESTQVFESMSPSSPFPSSSFVTDYGDLLTEDEETRLEEEALKIYEKYGCIVIVVTTRTLGGKYLYEYAEDFFVDNFGAGDKLNGIMLLISMEDRDYDIATRGKARDTFSDRRISEMEEKIVPELSVGRYYEAFKSFYRESEKTIADSLKGPNYLAITVAALVIGFLLSMIPLAIMKSKLKTVRKQSGAANYIRADSMNLTTSRDIFLYANTTSHHIDTSSRSGSSGGFTSTHSSGTTFTHHSGKF